MKRRSSYSTGANVAAALGVVCILASASYLLQYPWLKVWACVLWEALTQMVSPS